MGSGCCGKKVSEAYIESHSKGRERVCMVGQKVVPRLRECFMQVGVKVISNNRNKILQTCGPLFGDPCICGERERECYRGNSETGSSMLLSVCAREKLGLLCIVKMMSFEELLFPTQ